MSGLRATARAVGIDHAQLKRLADNGQVPRNADGSFDLEAVRSAIVSNVDPAFSRKPTSRKAGDSSPRRHHSKRHQSSTVVTTPTEARDAVALIARVLAEEGVTPKGPPDLLAARLAETILKARGHELRIAERRRKLVPADAVHAHFTKCIIGIRREIERMPDRHGAEMAAQLGCDPGALDDALRRMIHATLTEMSTPAPPA